MCEPSNRKPKSLESSKLRRMKCFCLPPVEHWHWGLKGQGLKWERWSRGTWALLPRQQDTIMRKSMVAQDLAKVSQVPSLLTPAVVADILYEGRSRPLHLCLTRWRRLGRICKMAKDEALVISWSSSSLMLCWNTYNLIGFTSLLRPPPTTSITRTREQKEVPLLSKMYSTPIFICEAKLVLLFLKSKVCLYTLCCKVSLQKLWSSPLGKSYWKRSCHMLLSAETASCFIIIFLYF